MAKIPDTVTFKTIRTEAGVAYSLDDWLIRGKVTPDSRHRSEYGIPLRARNIVVALLQSAAGREALEVYTDAVAKEAVVTAAAQKLAARGWFKPSRCADKETSADMAAMLRALKGAGELYCTGCGRIGQIDSVKGAPPAADTPDTKRLAFLVETGARVLSDDLGEGVCFWLEWTDKNNDSLVQVGNYSCFRSAIDAAIRDEPTVKE